MSQHTTITVLGLGLMGTALSLSFLRSGLTVYTWNRTSSRPGVKEVISQGGHFHDNVREALEPSSLIILCLADYDGIYANLESLPSEIFAGKTIVNLQNGTPAEARAMSSWMHERGVKLYFDGGIMNTPEQVGRETAFIFLSGEDKKAFNEIKTPLSSIGRFNYLGPDPGAAALHDNALLAGMYGMFAGAMTSIALLSRSQAGTSTAPIVRDSLVPMLQAVVPYVTEMAADFDAKDWRGHNATNTLMEIGMRNIVRTCEGEDVDPWFLKEMWTLFGKAVEGGRGDEGLPGAVRDLVGKKGE